MGIAGAGVSAVAAFAKSEGYEISGCDLDRESQFLEPLIKNKVEVFFEHDPKHLKEIDILVVSPAIASLNPDNKELSFAREKNLPVMIGEEFLAKFLIKDKKILAITGTHGKSTTTAMVGRILEESGFDPSVFVGAVVLDWGRNYRIGKGDFFVLEADEYQEKFLLYKPFISVVTALEMDHPEYFKDRQAVKSAFQKFVLQTRKDGFVVLGNGVNLKTDNLKTISPVNYKFELKLFGNYNQENAQIAATVGKILQIPKDKIKTGLKKFSGVSRRFEFKGEEKEVKIFEDYAHHPTAIACAMEAAKERFKNCRIWLVYQPHMFSRTKYLFNDFVKVFKSLGIHETILVDIFPARQENIENIYSKDIVKAVNQPDVKYIGDFEKTANYLTKNVFAGDLVVVMGAGDVYKLSSLLLKKLANKI